MTQTKLNHVYTCFEALGTCKPIFMTFAAGAATALGAFHVLYPLQQSLGLELRQQGTVSDTGTSSWLADHAERPAAKLHSAPKQCVSMHVVYVYIHKLPFQLQPISREEHWLVLAVPPHSLIALLGVWPFHQHLQ